MAEISLKIKSDFKQAQKDFNNLKMTSEDARKKIEKFQDSFKTKQIDKFIARNKLNATAIRATQGPMKALSAESRGLQREMQRLIKNGLDPQSKEVQRLSKDYIALQQQIGKTDKKEKKLGTTFKSVTASILAAGAIEGAIRKVGSAFTFMISEARKMEDATAAFTPLLGSTAKAEELVNKLNTAAAETPFKFQNISKVAGQLLPVMNGDIEKVVSTFKMLGDTAGGNAQKLDSITRGYTKAMLKTKVDMESLNMIAEAGVPIFSEMAGVMGFGKNEMDKFFKVISSGKVKTDVLTETFKRMTSEGGIFFQGMIIASKTTSGVLSTLSDNIALTAGILGKLLLPFIKAAALKIIEITAAIRKWLSEGDNLKNFLQTTASVLKVVLLLVGSYAVALAAVTIAQKAQIAIGWIKYLWLMRAAIMKAVFATNFWAIAQKALNFVLNLNPIGLIIIAVALLGFAIYKLIKNWDKVKFAIIDFTQTARIKLFDLAIIIVSKVAGAVTFLLKRFAKLPFVGKYFRGIMASTNNLVKSMKWYRWQIVKAQRASRAAFKASQKQTDKGVKKTKKQTAAETNLHKKRMGNYKKLAGRSDATLKKQIKDAQKFINIANAYGKTEIQLENEKHNNSIKQLKLAFDRKLLTQDQFQKAQRSMTEDHAKKAKAIENKNLLDKANQIKKVYSFILSNVSSVLNSIAQLSQVLNDNEIKLLDEKMNRELSSAGLLEDTQKQQAQREFNAAVATGNALDIEEKRRALEKIKIEEKYQTKREELEYKGALAAWQMKTALAWAQVPLATLNGFTSGMVFGPVVAGITAAAALAGATVSASAVSAAKPTRAETGLRNYQVPDISEYRNDNAPVMAGPGETVDITPRSESGGGNQETTIYMDEERIFSTFNKGIRTGKIIVTDRNVGSGAFAT